jgi:hypothetical protein
MLLPSTQHLVAEDRERNDFEGVAVDADRFRRQHFDLGQISVNHSKESGVARAATGCDELVDIPITGEEVTDDVREQRDSVRVFMGTLFSVATL